MSNFKKSLSDLKKSVTNLNKKKDNPDKKDNKNSNKKKADKKDMWIKVFLAFVSLCVVVGIGALIYLKVTIDASPAFNVDDFENTESTKIVASDGTVFADVGLVNRENVSYEEIPQAFIDAMISVEDSRFFEHNGFDLPRFVKSILENIKTLSFSQGASTITMQLVRNVYFTDDATQTSRKKSIDYKIQQIYLALKAEQNLNKKTIFELFVNRINFGANTTRGIKGAANYYFGKEVNELTLDECAYLAGVINLPNGYNAYKNYAKAETRRNVVLDLMERHGYISEQECDLAKSIPLANKLVGVNNTGNKYQAYVNEVVDEVIALTGKDPYTTTMTIYTHMDREVQDTIEAIQNGETNVKFPDELMQTAMMTIDNQTGAIIGIGGGRGNIATKGFSRVTDMKKQPGSAVKPLLSYALAFEYLGWATTHPLEDKPVAYRGTDIQIKNFDGSYKGQVLLTDAMGVSLNIPAYLTLENVVDNIGAKKVVEYLNSIGFNQITTDSFDLGYSIGGSTFEVTVQQMAAAHGAIVNGGNYITPHSVSRIEFADGSEPYVPTYASTRVISEEAAYLATSLMEQNVSVNYGNYMQILQKPYEVYAKTGTTNYDGSFESYGIPNGAAKDKWMIASTGEHTTAVWIGYDKPVAGEDTFIGGEKSKLNIPGKINRMILDALYNDHQPRNVQRPDDIVEITHVKGLYPYTEPVADMNPEMVVTGLINRNNYSLTSLSLPTVSSLTSFTANLKRIELGNMVITVNFATYPDEEKLEISDGSYDISTEIGENIVNATGTKLYDPSWVFGPIQYKATITDVEEPFFSDKSQFEITVPLPTETSTTPMRACGFYAYEKGSIKSNEICQDVEFTIDMTTQILDTKTDIDRFITDFGLDRTLWTFEKYPITDLNDIAQVGNILSVHMDGHLLDIRTLSALPWEDLTSKNVTVRYISDFEYDIPNFTTKAQVEDYITDKGITTWNLEAVDITTPTQNIHGISHVSPSDPRGQVLERTELLATTYTFYYYEDVDVTIPSTIGEFISFAQQHQLTTEDLSSVPESTPIISITGNNTYSANSVVKLSNLGGLLTVTY